MFRIHFLLLCSVPIVSFASTEKIAFASQKNDTSVSCVCSKDQGCLIDLLSWIVLRPNGSAQFINTDDQNKKSRYKTDKLNDAHAQLKIANADSGDSGRYYCVEHGGSYLPSNDNGTSLQVGDTWTDKSEVLILHNRVNDGYRNDEVPTKKQRVELRCVVTNLNGPFINVLWHSSGRDRRKASGVTWSFMESNGMYTVTSELLQNEVEVEVDSWWCEVQAGVHQLHESPKLFFHVQEEVERCTPVFYSVVVLCILFAFLGTVTCYKLCHQSADSSHATASVSSSPDAKEDVYNGVTYSQLDLKKSSKKGRRHEKMTGELDRMVYSEVRYKCDG